MSLEGTIAKLQRLSASRPLRATGPLSTLAPTVGSINPGYSVVSIMAASTLLVTLRVTPVTMPVAVGVIRMILVPPVSETRAILNPKLWLKALITYPRLASALKMRGATKRAVPLATTILMLVFSPPSVSVIPVTPQVVTLLAMFRRMYPFRRLT